MGSLEAETALPTVSVIVPVFNGVSVLPRTTPSVLQQDHPAEIFYVDDASSDGTAALLAEMTAGQPDVRILTHSSNRGRAAARNTGLAAASGDVLLFLDADVRPEPGVVRAHAEMHRRPGIVGALSRSVLDDLDLADPYHLYLRKRAESVELPVGEPLPLKYFVTTFMSVKAAAAREVGGFDERIRYGEDLDFAYRLTRRYPDGLRYASDAIVHHLDHGHLDDRLAKLRAFGRDTLPYLLRKHPGLAAEADLGFVLSRGARASWRTRVQGWLLQPWLGHAFLPFAARLPAQLAYRLLRYTMAAEVAAAYREGQHSSRLHRA